MKKLFATLALIFALGSFVQQNDLKAQNFNISINIGNQPAWGPVGYDYVEFYYIPEIDCYYNVPRGLFYYQDRGRWVSARYLPPYYARYDLYRLHKIVVNGYNDPWRYHRTHYNTYRPYVGVYNQPVIRYSNDRRYNQSRNNRYDWVQSGGSQYHAQPDRGRASSFPNNSGRSNNVKSNSSQNSGRQNSSTKSTPQQSGSSVRNNSSNSSNSSNSRKVQSGSSSSSSSRSSNQQSGRTSGGR